MNDPRERILAALLLAGILEIVAGLSPAFWLGVKYGSATGQAGQYVFRTNTLPDGTPYMPGEIYLLLPVPIGVAIIIGRRVLLKCWPAVHAREMVPRLRSQSDAAPPLPTQAPRPDRRADGADRPRLLPTGHAAVGVPGMPRVRRRRLPTAPERHRRGPRRGGVPGRHAAREHLVANPGDPVPPEGARVLSAYKLAIVRGRYVPLPEWASRVRLRSRP